MSLKRISLSMMLLGGLALSACGDDSSADGDTPKDATAGMDATGGGGDAGPGGDASTPDFGPRPDGSAPDGGTPDSGPTVPADTEGGPCTPDPAGMNPQGSCPAGLACAVWAVDDTTGAPTSATCVRECGQDADCAASTVGNNLCRNIALSDSPYTICVKDEGAADDYCIGSLLSEQGDMAGCAPGLDCLLGFFTDLEPYEGLCIKLCDPTGQDPNAVCDDAMLPYCNPRFVTFTSSTGETFDRGYCAEGKHEAGALCKAGGLTGRCDTSTETGDLGCVGGLTPSGTGVCFEFCDLTAANPTCAHSDPGLGQAQCAIIDQGPACQNDGQCTAAGWDLCAADGFCGIADGVCSLPCSSFPEDCSGPGEAGAGRTCVEGIGFDLDQDGNFNGIDLCLDVVTPVLVETTLTVDASGAIDVGNLGDNCQAMPGDLLRCPDYTTCIPVAQGQALCLRGCNTATTAADPRGGCETDPNTTTSVCSNDFFMMPPFGVCVD